MPQDGKYKEILNTDDQKYGGSGIVNNRVKRAEDKECDAYPQSVTVKAAPQSVSILQYIPYTEEELQKIEEQHVKKKSAANKAADKNTKKKEVM